mmetsp:Transcript_6702/g.18773  ORF Transcript_6702/g.18773 Transcript_6702/m.18773 type:complete len:141 (+) Transcript_6702:1023-1445(+)
MTTPCDRLPSHISLHISSCNILDVAVTGLPSPDKEHAINMVRFARDCVSKMKELTRKLEITLGPDTGDLSIRCGLHSGQVTAGVLRGERSRFQVSLLLGPKPKHFMPCCSIPKLTTLILLSSLGTPSTQLQEWNLPEKRT